MRLVFSVPCDCCDPCETLGETLLLTLSSIVSCGCREVAAGIYSQVTGTISGINGSFQMDEMAPAGGYDHEWGAIGFGDYIDSTYPSGDSDCSDPPIFNTTVYMSAFLVCGSGGFILSLRGDTVAAPTDVTDGFNIIDTIIEIGVVTDFIPCAGVNPIGNGQAMVEE